MEKGPLIYEKKECWASNHGLVPAINTLPSVFQSQGKARIVLEKEKLQFIPSMHLGADLCFLYQHHFGAARKDCVGKRRVFVLFYRQRSRGDKVVLGGLVDACSEVLWEAEEIAGDVWVWTVQADLQMVESDELGFNMCLSWFTKTSCFSTAKVENPSQSFCVAQKK